ncbi:MAG: TonB-dependent receptor [Pseudomonadota bacterium]
MATTSVLACGNAAAQGNAVGEDALEIDEIFVTATRREESIQDIGISVSALSQDDLINTGVETFFDFATDIPNLSFGFTGDGALGARGVAIRGVGGSQTTGFYIDDVPIIDSLNPRILDIERIEILRGPQGTLFGARSMGGLIRLVTAQPDTEVIEGYGHAGVSFTEEGGANYIADGAINMPLVEDRLAIRISAFYQYDEGIFEKGFGGPIDQPPVSIVENIDDQTSYGGQIALRWEATENLTITPRILYQYVEIDGFPFADLTPGNFLQRQIFDRQEGGTDEWYVASLVGEYRADWGTIVSTTSYTDRFVSETEDSSNAFNLFFGGLFPEPVPAPITRDTGLERFVHETRFASTFGGRFQVNTGFFYADSTDAPFRYLWTGEGTAATFANPNDIFFTFGRTRTEREISVFGEVSYDILSNLQATIGARYFDNKTTIDQNQTGVFGPSALIADQAEDGINLKFLVEYEPTADLLFYGSASEGYRIGGSNFDLIDTCDAELAQLGIDRETTNTFDSDSLWTYELGGKASLADGRVTMNAAAFRTRWNDRQTTVLLQCGQGFTANVGQATIDGFEIELAVEPIEGLSFGVNAGYNDARITDAGQGTGQQEGDPIFQVPDWTFAANAGYVWRSFDDYDGFVRAEFSHIGDSFSATNDTANPRLRPSYNILDARIGFQNDRYMFTLYAKNLTNEIANLGDNRSIGIEVNNLQRIVINRPRTIGMEVRASF